MKVKSILLIVIQLTVLSLCAQDLKQSLGGIKTNFQFYSNTLNLEATDQIIIQRAERNTYSDSSFGTGWGYGYQSIHLEFITGKQLVEENFDFKAGRNNKDKIEMSFYDSNNNLLATCTNDFTMVDLFHNSLPKDSPFFYSIDLIDIPIVLLDKTAKINLVKKTAHR